MTALELQTSKQSLIESILSIEDAETLEKVKKYIHRICKSGVAKTEDRPGPLVMTDEAFRETVIRSTQEFRNGGKTCPNTTVR
ncbi:hypothetical protein DW083_03390 [Parabacteroides sp. AF48-14]|uniref:hypothetical protein n=1 Tax=Parabacteroides sp. AF48-14 TaxID=2292052 RepID=UPI000EFF7055|nr:hypothetical protein [Parabacteroides sp. AF48-14]RHO74425.1 hypothetical protein DW083_03390 [Parabacteroides sp. AF48-14]